jgi:signal transduction histidine kinase
MLAEIFIFVPSIARFRQDYLLARLERAQIASLAQLATDGMQLERDLQYELLENAQVLNVVLRRDAVRQLILSSDAIPPISATFDMRDVTGVQSIGHALRRLITSQDQTIRVIGQPVRDAGSLIEITIPTAPLRMAMIDYGLRILMLSTFISVFTAALLYVAVRRLLVLPIKRVVSNISAYANAPEDAAQVIRPRASVQELRMAELALQSLQTQLTAALKQRERLAQLGQAVAKISHDLRNILSTATLVADHMDTSQDPIVRRMAPRLMSSLNRAVSLTESTLAFGRANEPAPCLDRVALVGIVQDVIENEKLSDGSAAITYQCDIERDLIIRADPEQLHRVLSNLVKNARQAILGTDKPGTITLAAHETPDEWQITVCDTGPGLPQKARDHLFQPFHGGVRPGGTGLGLAICAELIRGHGGALDLRDTTDQGTCFVIRLPSGISGPNSLGDPSF